MPNRLKQILSGVMIFGDIIFIAAFASILFDGAIDTSIGVIMIVFLIIDALLTVDYIRSLEKQSKAQIQQEEEEALLKAERLKREAEDREWREVQKASMAEELKSALEDKDQISTDELRELLQSHLNGTHNSNLHG